MNCINTALICLITTITSVSVINKVEAQKQYTNPILPGFYPDPSICRVAADYYIVNSSFAYFPGLPIFHSKDLVNWKQIGNAMNRPEQMNLIGAGVSRGLFAPAISYHSGIYYIVCTLIDNGGNFVITATNPAGPWSNPTYLKNVRGIDPSLMFDKDSNAYIVYNSDPPDNKSQWDGHRTIRMQVFDYKNLRTIGEEKLLVNGGSDISKNPVWIEGPHLYHVNDWYYLMCAEGGTGDKHSEVIFRSKNIEGPFISYAGNPILTQSHLNPNRPNPVTSTGHADLVETHDGKWYAVFLGCRPYEDNHVNLGRETFMAPVHWTTDGWPVITRGLESVQYHYPVPELKITKVYTSTLSENLNYKNDFKAAVLDPRFIFLRTVTHKWYNTTEKKGFLSVQLRPETISGKENPAFLGLRQQHNQFTSTTALEFVPKTDYEKAGISIFQNEQHYYFIAKSIAGGKPVVQVYRSTAGEEMLLIASEYLPSINQKLYLRIEQKKSVYLLSYSINNRKWTNLNKVEAKFLSTKTAGGFVGCVLGLYATSQGRSSNNIACFDWWDYKGRGDVYKRQ